MDNWKNKKPTSILPLHGEPAVPRAVIATSTRSAPERRDRTKNAHLTKSDPADERAPRSADDEVPNRGQANYSEWLANVVVVALATSGFTAQEITERLPTLPSESNDPANASMTSGIGDTGPAMKFKSEPLADSLQPDYEINSRLDNRPVPPEYFVHLACLKKLWFPTPPESKMCSVATCIRMVENHADEHSDCYLICNDHALCETCLSRTIRQASHNGRNLACPEPSCSVVCTPDELGERQAARRLRADDKTIPPFSGATEHTDADKSPRNLNTAEAKIHPDSIDTGEGFSDKKEVIDDPSQRCDVCKQSVRSYPYPYITCFHTFCPPCIGKHIRRIPWPGRPCPLSDCIKSIRSMIKDDERSILAQHLVEEQPVKDECNVCTMRFTGARDDLIVILKCGHYLCTQCASANDNEGKPCPISECPGALRDIYDVRMCPPAPKLERNNLGSES